MKTATEDLNTLADSVKNLVENLGFETKDCTFDLGEHGAFMHLEERCPCRNSKGPFDTFTTAFYYQDRHEDILNNIRMFFEEHLKQDELLNV